jgi:phosphatidylglycerophosphatase A
MQGKGKSCQKKQWLNFRLSGILYFSMGIKRLLASCFGLGWLPIAPGTWGSLPSVAVFILISYLGASALTVSLIMAGIILLSSFICVKCSPASIAATGENDPHETVADEVAGQAVTFIGVYAVGFNNILVTAILGFLLFRFFDVLKPWPIKKLEKFPAGWGILLDDLLAGIYAGVVLIICLRFWIY